MLCYTSVKSVSYRLCHKKVMYVNVGIYEIMLGTTEHNFIMPTLTNITFL